METVLVKALSFILIILCAYALKRAGIFCKEDNRIVMKLILNVTLPAAVVAGFGGYTRDLSLVLAAFLGFGLNVVMMLAGYLAAYRKSREEQTFNIVNYSGYNIGTFAMPYLQSFLGNAGTIVACIFDAGNALMCTGLTYAFAAGFCGKQVERGLGAFAVRLFASVPFDVYGIMLALYVLDVHLPEPVYRIASAFGSGNAFLAMFMIGLAFELKLERDQVRDVAWALIIRFGCAAVFALGIYYLTSWPRTVRQTLALIVFAPVSAMTVINTQRCGGDTEKAGVISSLSILTGIIVITSLVIRWNLSQ